MLPTWPTGYKAENPAFGSAANSAPGRPSRPPLQEPSRPSAPAPSGAWAASRRDPSPPGLPARPQAPEVRALPSASRQQPPRSRSEPVRGSFCPALLPAPRGRARARTLPWQRETSGRPSRSRTGSRRAGRSRSARGRGLPRATGEAADRCVGRGQRWPACEGKACRGEKRIVTSLPGGWSR